MTKGYLGRSEVSQQWIMVAGPYSSGNASPSRRATNLRVLNEAALEIFKKGHIPIIGVNLALPLIDVAGENSYSEIMMPISLAAASRCDAVLRIGGASQGADEEVEQVRLQGGSIYKNVSEIPAARHESAQQRA